MAAPRTWRNLRDETRHAVQGLDPEQLRSKEGIYVNIRTLEERYPDRKMKELPRLCRRLLRECRYSPGTDVSRFFPRLRRPSEEVGVGRRQVKRSSNRKGHFALELSGFNEQEESHIFGLSSYCMDKVVKGIVEDVCPKGSRARRHEKNDYSRGKRLVYVAAQDDGVDEGWCDVDDDGSMRAADDYHECHSENPDVEWAEKKVAGAEGAGPRRTRGDDAEL